MSRREVIVCRGIWYVMALLSLFGLSISLNLLWPPGGKSPALSRFLRDGECHNILCGDATQKDFTTEKERIPQVVFEEFSILALFCSPYLLVDNHDVWLYMSLFTISLFTGGIGLIQLSYKFRMDMKHAYITLLCGWLCCRMFALSILLYNFPKEEFSIISRVSPLPA
ncbi:hypothetical protein Bca4012_066336 [Brassica carinata]|uniref:Uncharacterized protein n=1 Tax=Brassica carinata TaxID=52824 RepID=A0A8X8AXP0_BRACI|nr:hypothetical protein Bca52824_018642 [Brassica carinata]